MTLPEPHHPSPGPSWRPFGASALVVAIVFACGGASVRLYDEDHATSNAPIRSGARQFVMRGELADAQRALREGDAAAAQAFLEAALRADPTSVVGHYHLGLVHMDAGRFEPARLHLERAVELEPELFGAWSNLGVLYLEHGESAAALKALEQAFALVPDDPRVLLNLGNARIARGLWSDGVDAYQAALLVVPTHATVLYNLGLAYAGRHRWEQALTFIDKALVYRPGFAQARALRVAALTELGRPAEAVREGTLDLERIAPAVENLVALGRAYLRHGDREQAREHLADAVKLDPTSPLARMTFGEALDAFGDRSAAAEQYVAFLALPRRRLEDARRLRHRLRELQPKGQK